MIERSDIYRMSTLIRYSTQMRIKDENIATHSFFVVWFTKLICDEFKLNTHIKLLAYETALMHDIPECYTNDITYDVKQMIPQIDIILKPYEEAVIMKESEIAHKVLFNPQTHDEIIAKQVVKCADTYSVLQYCENEVMLGNYKFKELENASRKRLDLALVSLTEKISAAGKDEI